MQRTNDAKNNTAADELIEMIEPENVHRKQNDHEVIMKARTPRKIDDSSPTCLQNLSRYFSQYCGATSIHGVQYLGERGRFITEKVAWTMIITTVWYFCLILISKQYNKWQTSPIIVSFATVETPISTIPFPAVTICPEVKTDPEVFNYTDILIKKINHTAVSDLEDSYFISFSLICEGINRVMAEKGQFTNGDFTIEDAAFDYLQLAFPDIADDNVSSITWLQKPYEFEDLLSHSITNEGICYTFNMLHPSEILKETEKFVQSGSKNATKAKSWTLEDGYPEGEKLDTFPRRTFLSGINGGFTMSIMTNGSHLDYLCADTLQGFKVTLHHPSELPDLDHHFRLPLDQNVLVAIRPQMIVLSDELRNYKVEDRKCYFATERYLEFFTTYTQRNCLSECYANFTLEKCGCVGFYMPKLEATPICGPKSLECLDTSKVNYLMNDVNCNCLPSCTSLEYDVEISQSEWNWKKMLDVFSTAFKGFKKEVDYTDMHQSRLSVYYKELQFLTLERHELYGYVDFFSNIGGLLGLFMGFSVTSCMEILYFLTLRLACNITVYGKRFWSADPELLEKRGKQVDGT